MIRRFVVVGPCRKTGQPRVLRTGTCDETDIPLQAMDETETAFEMLVPHAPQCIAVEGGAPRSIDGNAVGVDAKVAARLRRKHANKRVSGE